MKKTLTIILAIGFVFAALGLALAGCTVYSSPEPVQCGGTLVATLRFSGLIDFDLAKTTCAFAGDSNVIKQEVGFTGEVHWDPTGTDAAICIAEPHAEPHVGTHSGNALSVTYVDAGTTVASCSSACLVRIAETIAGTLQFQGTTTSGFTGTMTNHLDTTDASGCTCNLPCDVTYAIAGTP